VSTSNEDRLFREQRPRLLDLAYRMLGSVSDAEDIVQDAFVRYRAVSAASSGFEAVESPPAYLTTIVSRLAIDHLRSARVRREEYVGEWLPEPLLTGTRSSTAADADVAGEAERADSLSLAFLVVLDALSPVQRAVFLLHDVFGYGYDEIAEIVDKSEANCRQLAVRARRNVNDRKPRFETSRAKRRELSDRFLSACLEGETEALVELLASDVVIYGDGGGKAPAAPAPIHGRERAIEFLRGLIRVVERQQLTIVPSEVNHQPGAVVLTQQGKVFAVVALEIADDQIYAVRSIVNPDKLRHLAAP
jgi:RNA polymerase sigma-70 factor (ECF subfamily)